MLHPYVQNYVNKGFWEQNKLAFLFINLCSVLETHGPHDVTQVSHDCLHHVAAILNAFPAHVYVFLAKLSSS